LLSSYGDEPIHGLCLLYCILAGHQIEIGPFESMFYLGYAHDIRATLNKRSHQARRNLVRVEHRHEEPIS
jgi:hypothetical protein